MGPETREILAIAWERKLEVLLSQWLESDNVAFSIGGFLAVMVSLTLQVN